MMLWGFKYEDKMKWHKKFAWFPRRLDDGQYVWLEYYEEKWHTEIGFFRDRRALKSD